MMNQNQPEETIVIKKRTITIRKPTAKPKLVVAVAEAAVPMWEEVAVVRREPAHSADFLSEIITAGKASMERCSSKRLQFKYVIPHEMDSISKTVLIKKDGKLVKATVAVFFGVDTRKADDEFRNKYFDLFSLKHGKYEDDSGKVKTTNKGLSKTPYELGSRYGYYAAINKISLRLHMVANGCPNARAMEMSYAERVKWILTADYDKADGEVWKEVVKRYGASVKKVETEIAPKPATKPVSPAKPVKGKKGKYVALLVKVAPTPAPTPAPAPAPAKKKITVKAKAKPVVEEEEEEAVFQCAFCGTKYGDKEMMDGCCKKKKMAKAPAKPESDDEAEIYNCWGCGSIHDDEDDAKRCCEAEC